MALKDELVNDVRQTIAAERWTTRKGQTIPSDNDLKLSNDAVELEATVLYADISDSTKLVDTMSPAFAAEVYKTFLRCATKIIRSEKGTITAFDGDRVMAVFIGNSKNTSAVRTGLKINTAVNKIINPQLKETYSNGSYVLHHTVGIDTSTLFIVRGGIRGSNDLLWISQAANHAARLCTLPHEYPTWITAEVYNNMHKDTKTASDGRSMWELRAWTAMNNRTIYRSNFYWTNI